MVIKSPIFQSIIFMFVLIVTQIQICFQFQNNSQCTSNTYFDTLEQNCMNCQPNQIVDSVTRLTCNCEPGTIPSDISQIGFKVTGACVACGNNEVVSSDGLYCRTCSGIRNLKTLDCSCSSGQATIDILLTGKLLTTKQCLTCATNAYQGPYSEDRDVTECSVCPNHAMIYDTTQSPWVCACDSAQRYLTSGNTCTKADDIVQVLKANINLDTIINIKYSKVVGFVSGVFTTSTVNSDTIRFYYFLSAVGCFKYFDQRSCQQYANLCVMNLYDETNIICQQFKTYTATTTNQNSWHEGFPWLYYESPGNIVHDQIDMKLKISLTPDLSASDLLQYSYQIPFYVSKYALNGTFLGMEQLTNQLNLCSISQQTARSIFLFGTSYSNECQINLNKLFNQEMFFYEMYLKDVDGSFIPLPVLLADFQDAQLTKPNDYWQQDTSKWRFTRRFFVFDNEGGIDQVNGYVKGGNVTIIRYATYIKFVITPQQGNGEQILRPYVRIEYQEKLLFTIQSDPYANIQFRVEYDYNTGRFFNTVKILFIILLVIIFLLTVARLYIWTKRNPGTFNPETQFQRTLVQTMVTLADTYGTIIFWFLFIVSAYWFCFFKMQKKAFIVMPPNYGPIESDSNYQPHYIIFGTFCGMKIFNMLMRTYRQSTDVDIFFIDWEKPKMQSADFEENVPQPSIWRTIFVANELNELQEYRYVKTEWTFIFLAVCIQGFGMEKLAAEVPSFTTDISSSNNINHVLKYFVTCFLFIVIGFGQLLIRKAFILWFPSKIQEFVDICSIANISLYILDENVHGYYIHGMSPQGVSEGTFEELKKGFNAESKGATRKRGLILGEQLQTFEIYIPWEMRLEYQRIYNQTLTNEINQQNRVQQVYGGLASQFKIRKALPDFMDYTELENRRRTLTNHLKLEIEGIVKEHHRYVLDKTPLQRYLGMPPVQLQQLKDLPYFYRDPGMDFQKIFFCGNEFELIMWQFCIFQVFQELAYQTLISLICSYIATKLLHKWRCWLGERNIARKTLIDQRFLI